MPDQLARQPFAANIESDFNVSFLTRFREIGRGNEHLLRIDDHAFRIQRAADGFLVGNRPRIVKDLGQAAPRPQLRILKTLLEAGD